MRYNIEEFQKGIEKAGIWNKMTTKFGMVFYILWINFVDGNIPKVNKCCQETEVSELFFKSFNSASVVCKSIKFVKVKQPNELFEMFLGIWYS